jgi:hypothetical protein
MSIITNKKQNQYAPKEGIFNFTISTAKQMAHTIGEKTQQAALHPVDTAKQVAYTIGEKTQQVALHPVDTAKQVAYTIGEKTQQVAQTLGYNFNTADDKEEFSFVTFVDPVVSPKDLLLVKSQLKHTQTDDKSKPFIDKDIHILKNHHKAVFAEIKQHRELRHTEIEHDLSAPFLTKEMSIKETPRKRMFEEIRQPHELKHVTMNDRSAPIIPKDVHIGVPTTEGLLVAGKERLYSALDTAKQVASTIGEKNSTSRSSSCRYSKTSRFYHWRKNWIHCSLC